jgi:hypothetical protein
MPIHDTGESEEPDLWRRHETASGHGSGKQLRAHLLDEPAPEGTPDPLTGSQPPGAGADSPGRVVRNGQVRVFGYGVTDLDGRAASYRILRQPATGRVQDNGDGTFSFDPAGQFEDLAESEGRDVSFTYEARDDQGSSATATVTITVTGARAGRPAAKGSLEDMQASLDAFADPGAAEPHAQPAAQDEAPEQEADAPGRDTIRLDGVAGGPGCGWSVDLARGQVVETNEDHVVLSDGAAGVVRLEGTAGEIVFEGIGRIEW